MRGLGLLIFFAACAPQAQDINVSPGSDGGTVSDDAMVRDGDVAPQVDGALPSPDAAANDAGGLPSGAFTVSTEGLFGGWVRTIAVAPGAIYAGTQGAGVFKSTDNGDHFTPASAGIGARPVGRVVVDPSQPASLWAIADDANIPGTHIFHSSDGAASWTEVTPPAPPFDAWLQLAAVGADVYLLGGAVYHSGDSGMTWKTNSAAIPSADSGRDLAIDPSNPKTAYLVTMRGFFKTTDAGVTWPPAGTGLPAPSVGQAYLRVVVDPKNPATLFLTTNDSGSGVFRSLDRGDHFSDMNATGINNGIMNSLGIDPENTTTLYLWSSLPAQPLFKSGDSGTHWGAVDLKVSTGVVYDFAAASSATLFTGWDVHGLRRSLDAGATWNDASNGISNVSVMALAHAPSSPATVYAGSGDGVVYRSSDGGRTWAEQRKGLEPLIAMTSVAVHPTNPDIVYAGGVTSRSGALVKGAVFKTIDGGTSWFALDIGQQDMNVQQLLIDPKDPKTVYVEGEGLIIKSTNDGVSFSLVALLPNDSTIVMDPQSPQTLYSLGNQQQRSLNGGANWDPWKSGMRLPNSADLLDGVSGLAIDPTNDMRMYACTSQGLYRSDDGGATFSHAGVGFNNDAFCTFVTVAPGAPDTVYALSGTRKLFSSTDAATTWAPLSLDAFAEGQLAALAVAPDDANTVLLGLFRSVGILRTETGGR
jgi:photosystem II stability/assembly factor-like uncharacterized protein